ncbi:dimethylhistidine N-methyltransferase [Gracilibacillus ureilyticus]|uniref:Dimethylhistidine N-methyltransferase n=1 Tax=Gracilibacillus ureilyticus TaxID=531814 RepID=A0A1H9T9N8_9BACI|nr:L-histidine N(alpha)-methyltransferase [Gracilibacillus ureilyticus]SER93965.1 dimethylhistidine N-methyltransferase [Gracilibacillus ureilyticus]
MSITSKNIQILDFQPSLGSFRTEVLMGLKSEKKYIDSKWLYDEAGSALFENITALPEYYPTRTELSILLKNAKEITSCVGEQVTLVDFGSGSSEKVKILLNEMKQSISYMPVDISKEFLLESAKQIANENPKLNVTAICADYTKLPDLPFVPGKKVIFFPGSTFGNFEVKKGKEFLKRISNMLKVGDGLLIGLDLKKSHQILNRAYNDDSGVTAAFNLNLLKRINRELDGNFDITRFEHFAFFNEKQERVEMHLKSLQDQFVTIGEDLIEFRKNETIHTENSYKFDLETFELMAKNSGFKNHSVWTDPDSLFSVIYLEKNYS